MQAIIWLVIVATLGALAYALWKMRRSHLERQRAAEERMANFLAQAMPQAKPAAAPPPLPLPAAPPQPQVDAARLLCEAAARAGEAGEPALSIQLYARLLSRYPDSPLAAQARAGVQAQKKRLTKP